MKQSLKESKFSKIAFYNRLANISTTATLVDTMKGMATMLNKTSSAVDVNNIQNVIMQFNTEMEKQSAVSDLIDDAMEMDEDEIDDQDVDQLLDDMEGGASGGKKLTNEEEKMDDFDKDLADLR